MLLRFLAISFFLIITASVHSNELVSTLPEAAYVAPQTVKEWLIQKKDIVLIDVREPSEYEAGHLDGAININYLDVEKHAKKFDHRRSYIFYCTISGWRAPYAANSMADLGFKNAYILEGGIRAWADDGQVIFAAKPNEAPKVIPYPKEMAHTLYHKNDKRYAKKMYLTRKELAAFNGQGGRRAYVAVNGVIYDVTQSRLWRGGKHAPSRHNISAGRDLSAEINDSPHGDKHLKIFPVVGWLVN